MTQHVRHDVALRVAAHRHFFNPDAGQFILVLEHIELGVHIDRRQQEPRTGAGRFEGRRDLDGGQFE